jgi:hypothetical protein
MFLFSPEEGVFSARIRHKERMNANGHFMERIEPPESRVFHQ